MTKTSVDTDPGGDRPDHLAALRSIAQEQAELTRREHFHVMSARAAGHSWEAIAVMLGVSRQAVHRRFKHATSKRN